MRLGLLLTLLYFVAASAMIWCLSDHAEPLKANEWGDLLAGLCGPVAFAWLIFGYRQQGQQIKQNTEAIEAQKEALIAQKEELKLNREALLKQAAELEKSVEQQQLLVTTEQKKV